MGGNEQNDKVNDLINSLQTRIFLSCSHNGSFFIKFVWHKKKHPFFFPDQMYNHNLLMKLGIFNTIIQIDLLQFFKSKSIHPIANEQLDQIKIIRYWSSNYQASKQAISNWQLDVKSSCLKFPRFNINWGQRRPVCVAIAQFIWKALNPTRIQTNIQCGPTSNSTIVIPIATIHQQRNQVTSSRP